MKVEDFEIKCANEELIESGIIKRVFVIKVRNVSAIF